MLEVKIEDEAIGIEMVIKWKLTLTFLVGNGFDIHAALILHIRLDFRMVHRHLLEIENDILFQFQGPLWLPEVVRAAAHFACYVKPLFEKP